MDRRPILLMKNITKSYAGIKALDKANLVVNKGEVHGLIGENGAGKSTLMKILAGAVSKDSGQIFLKDQEVHLHNPISALKAGIAIIYQELSLIPYMKVCENMFLGHEPLCGKLNMKIDWDKIKQDSKLRLSEMGANINPSDLVSSLSTSEQQIIEIARALETNADIFIMDEPTSALAHSEVKNLFEIIRKLKEAGKTIIYISHRLEEIMEITDCITVLRDGKTIGTVRTGESSIPDIVKMMVGTTLTEEARRRCLTGETLLTVKNLNSQHISGQGLEDISFSLNRGEILGITGLMGAGKTELSKVLFGIDRSTGGEIIFKNTKARFKTSSEAVRMGIGLVPENRQIEGLFNNRPLRENLSICFIDHFSNFGIINKKKILEKCNTIISELDIKCAGLRQLVSDLSGGNQQKVVVGKWLLGDIDLLILDEPTRGIDVGAKPRIHNIMRGLADSGLGIILISSEVPEVCRLCDKIIVLNKGKIAGVFFGDNINQEEVFSCVIGE